MSERKEESSEFQKEDDGWLFFGDHIHLLTQK